MYSCAGVLSRSVVRRTQFVDHFSSHAARHFCGLKRKIFVDIPYILSTFIISKRNRKTCRKRRGNIIINSLAIVRIVRYILHLICIYTAENFSGNVKRPLWYRVQLCIKWRMMRLCIVFECAAFAGRNLSDISLVCRRNKATNRADVKLSITLCGISAFVLIVPRVFALFPGQLYFVGE